MTYFLDQYCSFKSTQQNGLWAQCSLATGGTALSFGQETSAEQYDTNKGCSDGTFRPQQCHACLGSNNAHQLPVDAEHFGWHAAQEQKTTGAGRVATMCSGSPTLSYQCRPFSSVCHVIVTTLPLMNTDEGCLQVQANGLLSIVHGRAEDGYASQQHHVTFF